MKLKTSISASIFASTTFNCSLTGKLPNSGPSSMVSSVLFSSIGLLGSIFSSFRILFNAKSNFVLKYFIPTGSLHSSEKPEPSFTKFEIITGIPCSGSNDLPALLFWGSSSWASQTIKALRNSLTCPRRDVSILATNSLIPSLLNSLESDA